MSFAQQISEASGGTVYGLQPFGGDGNSLTVWARQQGDEIYGDDGSVVVKPETVESYWQYVLDAINSGAAPSASLVAENASAGVDQSMITTQRIAMAEIPNAQLAAFIAASGANLKVVKMPAATEGNAEWEYLRSSMYWAVSAGTEHPAEAALFVDFLVNNETAGNLLLAERGVPANQKMLEVVRGAFAPSDQEAADYVDMLKAEITTDPPAAPPAGASGIDNMMARYRDQVIFGQTTPAEAAEAFVAELTAAVDSA